MRPLRQVEWVLRVLNRFSLIMGLALALSGSFAAGAQDTVPGKTVPIDGTLEKKPEPGGSTQEKKPEPAKPPTNPEVAKPQLFNFGENQLAIEYWTVRDAKTGVVSIAGGQPSPTAPNLVLNADPNTVAFVAVVVTMEFTMDKASKVYVLGDPIEGHTGKYEIPGDVLTRLVGRLLGDVNAALPLQFDPSKPLPLDGKAKVKVTPVLKVTAADPLSKHVGPKLELGQPVELTLKVSTRRKLGPDEKQP